MGLFGGTKIYVSSVAYNLAGPFASRPNYLKTVVFGGMMRGDSTKKSMGDVLTEAYFHGPGSRLRGTFRWAKTGTNYDKVGMPTETLQGISGVSDNTALKAAIAADYGSSNVKIQALDTGMADHSWWAEQWVLANHNADFNAAWTSDINETTNLVTVTYPGHWSGTFTPADFDRDAQYLYCFYYGQDLLLKNAGIFIYKFGSGDTSLDPLLTASTNPAQEHYPFIPIRCSNNFLSSTYHPDVYEQSKKAYKKATGQKLDDVITELAGSSSLADIDYASIVFGVSLNTKNNQCKSYIYAYFHRLMLSQFGTSTQYDTFKTAYDSYLASIDDWRTWDDGGQIGPEPTLPDYPTAPASSTRLKSTSALDMQLDLEISWRFIAETTGTGLKKPTAKAGDLWWDTDTSDSFDVPLYVNGTSNFGRTKTEDVVRLNWQVDADNWKSLLIVGAVHKNYIYKGKFVETGIKDAIAEPEDTGFFVPLHKPTMDAMGMVNYTQVATESAILIINCYVVKKTSFLSALLKIIVLIVIIVITITHPEIGATFLGTSATVGAAIGLTGVLAVIAGSIINAIVSMIVMKILAIAATAIFGEKLGQLIAAVASFVAMTVGVGLMNGQSLSSIWATMGTAQNLLLLTNAVGAGVSAYVQGAMNDLHKDMEDFSKRVDKKLGEIQQAYADNIGYDNALIDPMSLTDSPFGNYAETPSQFFGRTLLTGSEIADISLGMIESFTDLTLSVDLANV